MSTGFRTWLTRLLVWRRRLGSHPVSEATKRRYDRTVFLLEVGFGIRSDQEEFGNISQRATDIINSPLFRHCFSFICVLHMSLTFFEQPTTFFNRGEQVTSKHMSLALSHLLEILLVTAHLSALYAMRRSFGTVKREFYGLWFAAFFCLINSFCCMIEIFRNPKNQFVFRIPRIYRWIRPIFALIYWSRLRWLCGVITTITRRMWFLFLVLIAASALSALLSFAVYNSRSLEKYQDPELSELKDSLKHFDDFTVTLCYSLILVFSGNVSPLFQSIVNRSPHHILLLWPLNLFVFLLVSSIFLAVFYDRFAAGVDESVNIAHCKMILCFSEAFRQLSAERETRPDTPLTRIQQLTEENRELEKLSATMERIRESKFKYDRCESLLIAQLDWQKRNKVYLSDFTEVYSRIHLRNSHEVSEEQEQWLSHLLFSFVDRDSNQEISYNEWMELSFVMMHRVKMVDLRHQPASIFSFFRFVCEFQVPLFKSNVRLLNLFTTMLNLLTVICILLQSFAVSSLSDRTIVILSTLLDCLWIGIDLFVRLMGERNWSEYFQSWHCLDGLITCTSVSLYFGGLIFKLSRPIPLSLFIQAFRLFSLAEDLSRAHTTANALLNAAMVSFAEASPAAYCLIAAYLSLATFTTDVFGRAGSKTETVHPGLSTIISEESGQLFENRSIIASVNELSSPSWADLTFVLANHLSQNAHLSHHSSVVLSTLFFLLSYFLLNSALWIFESGFLDSFLSLADPEIKEIVSKNKWVCKHQLQAVSDREFGEGVFRIVVPSYHIPRHLTMQEKNDERSLDFKYWNI